ncbi:tetratricopeptide repeat protein [Thermoproteota archaeon]
MEFSQKHPKALVLLLIAIGIIIYSNSLGGKFVWDDYMNVRDNTYIQNWNHLPEIFTQNIGAGSGQDNAYYRPIVTFTYLISFALHGFNEMGYHLVNVGLHILVALAIFCLVTILFKHKILSFITSLLFLVHPVQVETVSYISARGELIFALTMVLTLIWYAKWLSRPKIIFYVAMMISYLCALLSKESSVVLPALLILYHVSFRKKFRVLPFLSLSGLVAAYFLLRFCILRFPGLSQEWFATSYQRVPGFFVAVLNYIRILFFPFGLRHGYGGSNTIFAISDPRVWVGFMVVCMLIFYAFKKKKVNPLIFFSVGWFFVSLAPNSNIYPPMPFYMAEHHIYLPSIGLFLLLAFVLHSLCRKANLKKIMFVVVILLVSFYSFVTIKQNIYWRDPIEMYKKTVKLSPDNERAYLCMGMAYYEIGEYDKAIDSLEKAIAINPADSRVHYDLGLFYSIIGEYDQSIVSYKKAIEINPEFCEAYNNLGAVYYKIGEVHKAIGFLVKAVEQTDDYTQAWSNLGSAYATLARYPEAIESFKKVIELDPNHVQAYYDLAQVYYNKKQRHQAEQYYNKAQSLGLIHNNLPQKPNPYR